MLDLVHFFTFTCHDSLNLWLSCKVNEQAGGDAPKSIVPQAFPLQKWVHMLRKEGAPADICPPLPAPGWLCSEKWGGRRPRARILYKVLPLFWVVMLRKDTGFSAVRPGGHAPNFVIKKGVWHNLESLEPDSVIFECKEGPFVEHEEEGILMVEG